jgi:hypothetical protein
LRSFWTGLKLIAYLDKVAVRILDVDGANLAYRPSSPARSIDDFYALPLEVQDDCIQRGVGKQAEISAARDRFASNTWGRNSVLEADLVSAEMQ